MLKDTAIFLAAAVLAVPLFTRLGLGSVLGYLAAGALIGPSCLGFIGKVEETLHFAEFGVVLLLFLIGLELQPKRLWSMRRSVFGLGGLQFATTAAVFAALYLGVSHFWPDAFSANWQSAFVMGSALALSSTAFALQVLTEKNEINAVHGRAAFSILLFQDLIAIPVLAIIPLLASTHSDSTGQPIYLRAAMTLGAVVGIVAAGRFLLRPMFRFVVNAKSHELSAASALLVVIGTALLTEAVGLSMAMGSFLAGVILADSEYRHELEANIEPFKGLLLGLFFMAIGMSADLSMVATQPLLVFGLALGLVVIKFLVLLGVGRFINCQLISSLSLAVAISQGGEFAYVIFGAAQLPGLLDHRTIQLLTVVVTISMAFTPLLFMLRDAYVKRIEQMGPRAFDAIDPRVGHVIIAGFGRYGQIVARLLRLKRIPFTALDASPQHVDFVRRFGNKIYYGDASRVDLLRAAQAEQARLFVLAIDDPDASVKTAKVVQQHFPNLPIFARARNRQHAYALLALGIEHVERETFRGSLKTAQLVLEEMGLGAAETRDAIRKFIDFDEAMIARMTPYRDDEKTLIEQAKQYSKELEQIFEQDVEAAT